MRIQLALVSPRRYRLQITQRTLLSYPDRTRWDEAAALWRLGRGCLERDAPRVVERRLRGCEDKEQERKPEEGRRDLELQGKVRVAGGKATEEGRAPRYTRRDGLVYRYPRFSLVFLVLLASFPISQHQNSSLSSIRYHRETRGLGLTKKVS